MCLTKLAIATSMLPSINHLKCRMPMCIRIAVCVIVVVAAGEARADGLIYQLPPDGAWVRYDVQMKSTITTEGKDAVEMEASGTLLLSSVGQAKVKGEACRWIEIAFTISFPGAPKKIARIVKILIPAKHLKRGEDRMPRSFLWT